MGFPKGRRFYPFHYVTVFGGRQEKFRLEIHVLTQGDLSEICPMEKGEKFFQKNFIFLLTTGQGFSILTKPSRERRPAKVADKGA